MINPALNLSETYEHQRETAQRNQSTPVVDTWRAPTACALDGNVFVQLGFSERELNPDEAEAFAVVLIEKARQARSH